MKFPLIAISMASALLIAACGNDSSSSPNPEGTPSSASATLSSGDHDSTGSNEDSSGTNANSSDSSAEQGANSNGSQNGAGENSNSSTEPPNKDKYTFTTTGHLYVNRTSQILQMTANEVDENLCVVEGDNYSWKSLPLYAKPDSAKFEYHGDTLLLFNISNGSVDKYADTYVGGTVGDVYGKWTATRCEYDKKTSKTDCNDDKPHYSTHIMELSPDKIVSSLVVDVDKYIADHSDYMNSRLMLQIFGVLTGKRDNVYAEDIFDSDEEHKNTVSDLRQFIQDEQIHITKQTKTDETFELDGKTWTVNAENTSVYLQTTGHHRSNWNRKVRLTLSNGTTTCNLAYDKQYVDKDLCKAQNAEYIDIDDDLEDDNGNKFNEAYRYIKTNRDEFVECLKTIAVKEFDGNYM